MMDSSNNLSHSGAITSLTNATPFVATPTGSGASQHFIPRFAGSNQVSCFYEQHQQLDQQARNENTFCQPLINNLGPSDGKVSVVNDEPRDLPRWSNSSERNNYNATAGHQQMEYKETTVNIANQLNYQQEDSRYFQYHHQQVVQSEYNQHAIYSQQSQRNSHWQHQAVIEHSPPCNQFSHYTPSYYEHSQHYQEDIQDKLIYYHHNQQQQHHHHHQQQQQQAQQQQQQQSRYYIENYSYPSPEFYSLNSTTQEVSEYHQTRGQSVVDYPSGSYYQTETITSKDYKSTSEIHDICFPSSSLTSEPQTISTVPLSTQTQSKQTTNETQENSTWKKLLLQPEVNQHQHLQTKQLKKKVSSKSQSSDQVSLDSTPNSNQRNNQCEVCGRNYARPSTLKTHLRTHTNERPFKCNVCLKTFSQAANLTAHQRVHTGERPFSCPICGRQFSQSSSVITHLRTHSGERPYRCNMCSRTFSDSSTLTKHCRIHSGEKPYQCDYCPLNFSQSGNLSRHLKLHLISSTSSSTSSSSTSSLCSNNTSNSNNNNITTNSTQLSAYAMPSDSIKGDATSLRKSNHSSQYC